MREGLKILKYKKRVELKSGHDTFSVYDPAKIFVNGYWDYMGVFPELNNAKNILLLGIGCGTISRIILNFFPDVKIDGVDNDSDIIETAKKYFALEKQNVNVFIKDAQEFLENSKSNYDLILLDTFVELDIPMHLTTDSFFKMVKSHLIEKGIFCINVAKSEFAEEVAASLAEVFQNVYLLTAFNTLNTEIVASDSELDFERLKKFSGLGEFEAKKLI